MGIEGLQEKESNHRSRKIQNPAASFHAWELWSDAARREIWSLPLDRIDLEQGKIYISPVDQDGGLSKDGKPIHVKFKPKSGGDDWQPIVGKLRDFLAEDLANRNEDERWFLDKGDGSVWYASPMESPKESKKFLMN